jgi:hypothetical protein
MLEEQGTALLAVAVCSPGSAVDPQFCELEHIGFGLTLRVKGCSAPAKNRDALFFFAVKHNDGAARYPFAGPNLVGFELNPVAAVRSNSHMLAKVACFEWWMQEFTRRSIPTKCSLCRRSA